METLETRAAELKRAIRRLARAEGDGFLAEQLESLNEELAAVEGRLKSADEAPGKMKTDLPTEQEVLDAGDVASNEALAKRLGVNGSYVRRSLQRASLSPAVVETALERGRLDGISLTALSKDFPLGWQSQADRLGL